MLHKLYFTYYMLHCIAHVFLDIICGRLHGFCFNRQINIINVFTFYVKYKSESRDLLRYAPTVYFSTF